MASVVHHQVAFNLRQMLTAWASEFLRRPDNQYVRHLPIEYARVAREGGGYTGMLKTRGYFSQFGIKAYDATETTQVLAYHQFSNNSTTQDAPFIQEGVEIINLDDFANTSYCPADLRTAILNHDQNEAAYRPNMGVIEAIMQTLSSSNGSLGYFEGNLSGAFAAGYASVPDVTLNLLAQNNIKVVRKVEHSKRGIVIHTAAGSSSLQLYPQNIGASSGGIDSRYYQRSHSMIYLGSDGLATTTLKPRGFVWGAESAATVSTVAGSGQSESVLETVRAVMEGLR